MTTRRHHALFMGPMAQALHSILTKQSVPGSNAAYVAEEGLRGFEVRDNLPPKEMLERMKRAANEFYGLATSTGVHAFIEFAGLMNEFIKVCEDAQREGIEWWGANTHSKVDLPFQTHHVNYLNEKLECIFQGLSFGEVKKKETA